MASDDHPTPPDSRPEVDLVLDGGHAVEWLAGEIDVARCRHLLEMGVLALADPRIETLTLDFGSVTFIDSTGLGTLVELRKHAGSIGKQMLLRQIPSSLIRLFTITGLDQAFGLDADDPGRC